MIFIFCLETGVAALPSIIIGTAWHLYFNVYLTRVNFKLGI